MKPRARSASSPSLCGCSKSVCWTCRSHCAASRSQLVGGAMPIAAVNNCGNNAVSIARSRIRWSVMRRRGSGRNANFSQPISTLTSRVDSSRQTRASWLIRSPAYWGNNITAEPTVGTWTTNSSPAIWGGTALRRCAGSTIPNNTSYTTSSANGKSLSMTITGFAVKTNLANRESHSVRGEPSSTCRSSLSVAASSSARSSKSATMLCSAGR